MKKQVQPTLMIGLGGTGEMAISEIKKLMYQDHLDPRFPFPLTRFLAIDTEFITQSDASTIRSKFVENQLNSEDNSYAATYEIGLEKNEQFPIEVHKSAMKDYLKHPEKLGAADFVAASKMGRVVKWVQGDGAGGCGIVGKLAAWQNLTSLKEKLAAELNLLNNMDYIREGLHPYKDHFELSPQHQLNIFVLCSVGGGTGKGIFLTVGVLIRELLLKMGIMLSDGAEIMLVNYTPSCFRVAGRKVSTGYFKTIQANQYAALKELDFVLKYDYPLEKRLKEELNILDRDTSEKIYTNVLQVAAQLDSNGIYLGDYGTINQSVAAILTSYVFGNMVAEFRAYFRSNKGAYIGDNPLFENNGLQQERIRDYGRMGCYRLHLPLQQLFAFSKAYYATELLKDLGQGTLNSLPEHERMTPELPAQKLYETFLSSSQQLLQAQPFVNFQHLSQICSTFDHPWLANIQEAIRGCFNSLSIQFLTGADAPSPIENKIEQLLKRLLKGTEMGDQKGWTTLFCDYAFHYGLADTLTLLQSTQQKLATEVSQRFASLLKMSSNLPHYQTHFVYGQNDRKIWQLLVDQQQKLEEELLTYANGSAPAYYAADTALQNDRREWQKQNKGFWKLIFGQDEKTLQQSKGAIQQLLLTARQTYQKYVTVCQSRLFLESIIGLLKALQQIQQNIEKNLATLQADTDQLTTVGGGLIKVYQNQQKAIRNQPNNSLEIRITGEQEATFVSFAQHLKFDKDIAILPTLHTELRQLSDQLVQQTVAPTTIINQLESVTQRIDSLQKGQTLTSFLRQKLLNGAGKEVKRHLQALQQNAAFLGKLDTSTAEGGLDRAGFTRSIIQAEDPQLIHHAFPDLFDANTKVVPTENKESIMLTKLETALPLFLFQEFRAAQKTYLQLRTTETGLYEKHTHSHFVDLPEPFGTVTEMDATNLQAFLLVLQHLGIIRIQNGLLQFRLHPLDKKSEWRYLIDDHKNALTHLPEERQVSLEELLSKINHRKKWFDLLAQLTLKLLERIFTLQHADSRQKAIAYLATYFRVEPQSGKGFPPFPPVLLQYILEQTQLPALRHQLGEWKWFNQRKFSEWQQSPFYKMEQLPDSIEKMTPWFNKPDWEQLNPTAIIELPTNEQTKPELPLPKKKKKVKGIKETIEKETPTAIRKYLVATPEKEYSKKMTVAEIAALIKNQKYVVVSEYGNKYDDWKEWKDIPAIAKAVRKAG